MSSLNNAMNAPYSSGTFIPAFDTSDIGFTSVTYSTQVGTYVQIGKLFVFNITLVVSALTMGSASGNLLVSGLPVDPTPSGNFWSFPTLYQNLAAGSTNTQIIAVSNASTFLEFLGMNSDDSEGVNVPATALTALTTIAVSGAFQTP